MKSFCFMAEAWSQPQLFKKANLLKDSGPFFKVAGFAGALDSHLEDSLKEKLMC